MNLWSFLGRYVRQHVRSALESIFTSMPGLVREFDHASRRHRVTVKAKRVFNDSDENPDPPDPVHNIPDVHPRSETFLTRFPYDGNTPVMLGYSGRSLDESLRDDEVREVKSKRIFHPQDAYILGGVKAEDDTREPTNFENDYILVLNRKTGHYIRMTEEGDIFIYGRRFCTYSDQGGCPVSPPPPEYP